MMNAIALLWTSFFFSWVALCVLAVGVWFVWTRFYKQYTFRWQGPVVFATAFTLFSVHNTLLTVHQNSTIAAYQQAVQASQGAQNEKPLSPKEKFFRDVDAVALSGQPISKELKTQFDTIYKPMFKTDTDRKTAYTEIKSLYECQKYFWEDALASYSSGKTVKSEARKNCEAKTGTIFDREKLLTAEMVKNNDTMITAIAGHKRLPASDGKEVQVDEKMLRTTLETQTKANDNLHSLLTE